MCGWVALMRICGCCLSSGAAALVVRYALGNEAQEMTQDIVWFPSLTLNFPFYAAADGGGLLAGHAAAHPLRGHLLADAAWRAGPGRRLADAGAAGWLLAMAYAVLGWTVGAPV